MIVYNNGGERGYGTARAQHGLNSSVMYGVEVAPFTDLNRLQGQISLNMTYGDMSLVVHIGKAGKRLKYALLKFGGSEGGQNCSFLAVRRVLETVFVMRGLEVISETSIFENVEVLQVKYV